MIKVVILLFNNSFLHLHAHLKTVLRIAFYTRVFLQEYKPIDPVLVCKYYFYKNITLKIDSKQLFISAR